MSCSVSASNHSMFGWNFNVLGDGCPNECRPHFLCFFRCWVSLRPIHVRIIKALLTHQRHCTTNIVFVLQSRHCIQSQTSQPSRTHGIPSLKFRFKCNIKCITTYLISFSSSSSVKLNTLSDSSLSHRYSSVPSSFQFDSMVLVNSLSCAISLVRFICSTSASFIRILPSRPWNADKYDKIEMFKQIFFEIHIYFSSIICQDWFSRSNGRVAFAFVVHQTTPAKGTAHKKWH